MYRISSTDWSTEDSVVAYHQGWGIGQRGQILTFDGLEPAARLALLKQLALDGDELAKKAVALMAFLKLTEDRCGR